MKIYEVIMEQRNGYEPYTFSYGFYSNKRLAEYILEKLQKYDDSPWYEYKIVELKVEKDMPKWVFDTIEKYRHEYEMMERA